MTKPKSGLLANICVKRSLPRRWHDLYYKCLSEFEYEQQEPEDQMLIDQIGYCYVEIAIAREDLMDTDVKDKPDLGSIQKRLCMLLAEWRASRKKPANEQQASVMKELSQYGGGYSE